MSTTSVDRRGPPSMPRAELGIHGLRAGAATGLEKSEKRGVQVARNGPSEDGKCWQRVELGIHGLNRWTVNCLEMSGKRGVQTDKTPRARTDSRLRGGRLWVPGEGRSSGGCTPPRWPRRCANGTRITPPPALPVSGCTRPMVFVSQSPRRTSERRFASGRLRTIAGNT